MRSPSSHWTFPLLVTAFHFIWSVICEYPATELLTKFANSKILLVGLFESHLLIITNELSNLKVYDIDRYKVTNQSINLYGVQSELLEAKWSTLYTNNDFQKFVLSSSTNASHCTTIKFESEQLIFVYSDEPLDQKRTLKTVTFALDPPNARLQDYVIVDREPFLSGHYISSSEPNVFYNLKILKDESTTDDGNYAIQLFKYVFKSKQFEADFQAAVCKHSDEDDDDATERILFDDVNSNCTQVQWQDIEHGFTDGMAFRLFSRDKVYIFEHNLIKKQAIDVTVGQISDHLLVIGSNSQIGATGPSDSPVRRIAHVFAYITIAIVLIVLAIGVWLLCEYYFCRSRNTAKNDHRIALALKYSNSMPKNNQKSLVESSDDNSNRNYKMCTITKPSLATGQSKKQQQPNRGKVSKACTRKGNINK